MLNVWGVTVLRCAVTRSRVFCHFLWTRRKQLLLARESFSPSFRSIHHVAAITITIFELQRRIEAASVTKHENNWVDAEVRLLIDLWGDDQVQSDLESSCRNIVVYRRIAMQVNRWTLWGQWSTSPRCAARAFIYFLLNPLERSQMIVNMSESSAIWPRLRQK